MSTIMVFSHPNHEVSVLGTIGRKSPHVVFLTDGGGEERVRETQEGLSSYLPFENLHFLGHSEPSLYDALVNHDCEFFRNLAREVRDVVDLIQPSEIYCDAIEFYNPVHDMALPIVRAALEGREDIAVLEVPLIYQEKSEPDSYALQKVPPSLAHLSASVMLTGIELDRKMAVLRSGYQALIRQLGERILDAIDARPQRENFLRARGSLPGPAPDQVLRYDMRGRALKAQGEVQEAISYHKHYAAMFVGLCPETA